MRTIAALSVLAAAVALALLLWLFTRSGLSQQNQASQVPHAATSTEAPGLDPIAERETVRLTGHAPEDLPKPPIPESLARVFDESRDLITRMKAVDALSDSQPPEALAALRWLLREAGGSEALRNNVANRLRECGEEHLSGDLTEMLWNENETPKWRNYCVQHLYNCFEEEPDTAILDTLSEATKAGEKMVRICAIWSLVRLATPRDKTTAPGESFLARTRHTALAALREKNAHFLIRTAGVQSCARLGLEVALPDIRNLAADQSTKPTHLRVVSIAALGDLGDAADLPLLERLAESSRGQLKSAAALAAKKIKKLPRKAKRETEPAREAPAAPSKRGEAGTTEPPF